MCTNTTLLQIAAWFSMVGEHGVILFLVCYRRAIINSPLVTAIEGLVLWPDYLMITVNGLMVYRYLLSLKWEMTENLFCYWLVWLHIYLFEPHKPFTCYGLHSRSNKLPTTQITLKWTISWMLLCGPGWAFLLNVYPGVHDCRRDLVFILINGVSLPFRTVILLLMDSITLKWYRWNSNF